VDELGIKAAAKRCVQFTLRITTLIRDVNSSLLPDRSMLNFRSTARRSQPPALTRPIRIVLSDIKGDVRDVPACRNRGRNYLDNGWTRVTRDKAVTACRRAPVAGISTDSEINCSHISVDREMPQFTVTR